MDQAVEESLRNEASTIWGEEEGNDTRETEKMSMGSTERRIAALRIAASMKRRMAKEDPVPTAEALIAYAVKLEQYAYRGEGRETGAL